MGIYDTWYEEVAMSRRQALGRALSQDQGSGTSHRAIWNEDGSVTYTAEPVTAGTIEVNAPEEPEIDKPDFDFGPVSQVVEEGIRAATQKKNIEEAEKYLELLMKGGMKKAGQDLKRKIQMELAAREKYIVISHQKIKAFLERKVKEYDEYHKDIKNNSEPGSVSVLISGFNDVYGGIDYGIATVPQRQAERITVPTKFVNSTSKKLVGKLTWLEEPTETYEGIPPANILKVLDLHKRKNIFDYFTIASVKFMPDPILLGRIEGSGDRYYIAQWGDDVTLDDII